MTTGTSLRARLRALRVFGGELPYFDTDAAPDAPLPLLRAWLDAALEAAVSQPHAMALATATPDGHVNNRTLLLKDVDDDALWFASLTRGPKGAELAANPRVAILLYWREQGRQVRVTGAAHPGPRERSVQDFLERSPNARASAIAGEQSEPLADYERRIAEARALVAAQPEFVPEDWVAYRVVPDSVEFWQAERARDQVRLRYLRDGDGWRTDLLWP